MGLFGKKEGNDGLLGLDVGAGAMKLVELGVEDKRLKLLTFGMAERGADLKKPLSKAALLKELMKRSGVKAKTLNVSLPSDKVFHAILAIPLEVAKSDKFEAEVRNRSKKFLPGDISDMVIDTIVIDKKIMEDKKAKPGATVRVLVSGSPKDLVAEYVKIAKEAKLQLAFIETEAIAIIRSLVGNDPSRIMIVDIGAERSNITIVQERFPFLHRSIQAGGNIVTGALQSRLGVSADVAEQMKRDLASSNAEQYPNVIRQMLAPIIHEIRYSIELYKNQQFHEFDSIEKIILTGGSAKLPFIEKILTEELDLNVYIGDPWARIDTQPDLARTLDRIGPHFAVAAGLAMKMENS
jgi:type IV pilus assembly protein PilM